jgi:hypothetical protein
LKIIIGVLLSMLSQVALAQESLTVLNTGSKTGSFSMQATAYSTDLQSTYKIDLVNPGDRCVALNSLLPRITGPVFMPWASDYEAVGRDGTGCVSFDISKTTVLRYDSAPLKVCTVGDKDVTASSGKVGHTVPADGPLTRIVNEMNNSFGTSHKAIAYNGQGDTRLALINGEIDYAILSNKHALYVEENGGTCAVNLAADGEGSLPQKANNDNLVFGFDMVWLAVNMNDADAKKLKSVLEEKHADCESAIGKFTKCNTVYDTSWTLSQQEANTRWETVVKTQQSK